MDIIQEGEGVVSKAVDFVVRSKIWIEDEQGRVVFGRGRLLILEAIDRLGSLQAAAKSLHMSYRAVWCRVRESEKRFGQALVVRDGRGSRLTPKAQGLVNRFKRLQAVVEKESDEVYETLVSRWLK